MTNVNPTFSELWYRVADFRPKLSPHLIVKRHLYRGETWFVVGDPASSKFYRFNASAYRFLGLLDGRRTIQEAWEVCLAQLEDAAPTQRDCIDLLAQLQEFGLLRGDLPVEPGRLREKIEKVRKERFQTYAGNYVFWSIPLINPERILARLQGVGRVLYGPVGLVLWAALALSALRLVIPRWDEMASSFNSIIAPQNLVLLSACFMGLKILHEFSHGLACKAFGGRVTEIGLFFMLIIPVPYCDATASWAFPSKWQRIIVASAGVMAEVVAASIAAYVWAFTPAGFAHTAAFNVMVVASVVTFMFNVNPLLRYDGYYILSDLLEIPNLAPRAQELWKWVARRHIFGLKSDQMPPLHSRSEGAIMLVHSALAFPYRILVLLAIVMVIADRYFVIGLVLALIGLLVGLGLPLAKGMVYVATEPTLQRVRPRAVLLTFGLIAAAAGFIGFVPMPARIYAAGVVEPARQETVRAPQDGFVDLIAVQNGQRVDEGQALIRLRNPLLLNSLAQSESNAARLRAQRDVAMATSAGDRRQAEALAEATEANVAMQRAAVADMNISAPFAGTVMNPELDNSHDRLVRKGDPILVLEDLDHLVIRAYVDDAQYAWLYTSGQAPRIEARIYGDTGKPVGLEVMRPPASGLPTVRYESLTQSVEGGEVVADPTEQRGIKTVRPQWEFMLRDTADTDADGIHLTAFHRDGKRCFALPGTRAKVRFSLAPEPLARQWWRRFQQILTARYGEV